MWPNPQFPAVWSHLEKKSLMENFIFCAVHVCLNIPEYAWIYVNLPDWLLFYNSLFVNMADSISDVSLVEFIPEEIHFLNRIINKDALRKKCPHSEFFWTVFFCIRTEYGEIRTKKTPNTDTFYAVMNL